MGKEEQRIKIEEIKKKYGEDCMSEPSCLGDCSECDYRRDWWEEELGEEYIY